jgi:hypothetical protein
MIENTHNNKVQVMTYVPYFSRYTMPPIDSAHLRCLIVRDSLHPLLHGCLMTYNPVEFQACHLIYASIAYAYVPYFGMLYVVPFPNL